MTNYQALQIDITNRCNLHCQHCARFEINEGKIEPSFRKLKRIIKDAKELNFKEIIFSGGEPTIRSDIIKIIQFAKQQNLFVTITTNGIFNELMLNNLLKSNVDIIQISIDGPKKIHERIRGVNNIFDNIIKNISTIRKNKGKVIIKCVVQKDNYSHLENLIKIFDEKKIKRIALQNILPCGAKNDFWEKNKVSDRKLLNKIQSLSNKYKIHITTDNPKINLFNQEYIKAIKRRGNIYNGDLIAGCLAGITNFYIGPDLNVYPCSYVPYVLGNLYHTNLKSILRDVKKKRMFYREHLKGKCKSCRFKYICGGCRAIAYSMGDLYGEDFTCDI